MKTISDILIAARLQRPYYARILASLTPVPVTGLGTFAVDKFWRLYYDPEFIQTLTVDESAAIVVCHEVEHLLRDHAGRCRDRLPGAWNVAADAEINDDVDAGVLPDNVVTPESIGQKPGLMAEEYYDAIIDRQTGKCECGSGAGGRQLPHEIGADETAIEQVAADVVRDQVAADVRSFAANNPGKVPGGVVVWANARETKVVVRWQTLLYSAVASGIAVHGREDYSWSRPSRRNRAGVPLRPGMVEFRPRIVLITDTSWSMADRASVALGTIRSLVGRVGGDLVAEIACDTDASIVKYGRRVGGGGTDLRVGFREAEKFRPDVVVVVSDCETPWPDKSGKFSTVVANIGEGRPPVWAKEVKVQCS